jgi:hypothetical protein
MKLPHSETDAAVTVDMSAHANDTEQTWSDARGETTEPGPPPPLDLATGLGMDDGRTQPELIGPTGKLVGFGGLRPDVRVQAESAGRSAARYEGKATPARSVLPVDVETNRRIVVNQTLPMGMPVAGNQAVPASVTVRMAAAVAAGANLPASGAPNPEIFQATDPRLEQLRAIESPEDTRGPPGVGSTAGDNETVPRARPVQARRMWLAASVGAGIAIVAVMGVVYAFGFANKSPPTSVASPPADVPNASAAARQPAAPSVSASPPSVPALPTAVSASVPPTGSGGPAPVQLNGTVETVSSSAAKPRPPRAGASAAPSVTTRPSAVPTPPPPAVVPVEPKQAPPSGDILRSQ